MITSPWINLQPYAVLQLFASATAAAPTTTTTIASCTITTMRTMVCTIVITTQDT